MGPTLPGKIKKTHPEEYRRFTEDFDPLTDNVDRVILEKITAKNQNKKLAKPPSLAESPPSP